MNNVRPLLSACIIARDEAALLPRCIASLNAICDEIIVLDTGSQDDTLDVAKSLGACVSRDTSCNDNDGLIADFSQARNVCLSLARGTWILQIDADEILKEGHEELRKVMQSNDVDVLGITLRTAGNAWVGTRFFRANAAAGYQGRVHERLDYHGQYQGAPNIIIENFPNKAGKESSSERNLRLLKISVQEAPDDSRAWFYLGNEERRVRNYEAAAEAYQRCIEGGNHRISYFHARYYLAICQYLRYAYAEALNSINDAIMKDSRYAEGHCLRGDICCKLNNIAEAIINYKRALYCGEPPADAVFAVHRSCYGIYPMSRLKKLTSVRTTEEELH